VGLVWSVEQLAVVRVVLCFYPSETAMVVMVVLCS
jgi:hypothetical protein